MGEIRVSELEGAELDYWVAKAEGRTMPKDWLRQGCCMVRVGERVVVPFSPSRSWGEGGPIIERESISIEHDIEFYATSDEPWYAEHGVFWDIGATPLIATMRAYVKSKFGDSIRAAAEIGRDGGEAT